MSSSSMRLIATYPHSVHAREMSRRPRCGAPPYCVSPVRQQALIAGNEPPWLFKGMHSGSKFRDATVPVQEQAIGAQVRDPRFDVHLETMHVGEVPSPAARPEDAVIKQDVRVHVAGKDHAGHK